MIVFGGMPIRIADRIGTPQRGGPSEIAVVLLPGVRLLASGDGAATPVSRA